MYAKMAWALLALLALSPSGFAQEFEPPGRVIFSVEMTDPGHVVNPDGTPITLDRTGIFYFLEEATAMSSPLLSAYRFADGEIVGVGGEGSVESIEFLAELAKIPLVSFDVASRIEEVSTILRSNAQRFGGVAPSPSVRGGAKYRISYDYNGVQLSYEAWNPGPYIDALAGYDPDLAALNQVIDLFATLWGRRALGL